ALHRVLAGEVTEENLAILNEEWTLEEKCKAALEYWGSGSFELNRKMERLSGGEKTKVFLAGILIHQPGLVLMDEPTNHLDSVSRKQLYDLVEGSAAAMLVIS